MHVRCRAGNWMRERKKPKAKVSANLTEREGERDKIHRQTQRESLWVGWEQQHSKQHNRTEHKTVQNRVNE